MTNMDFILIVNIRQMKDVNGMGMSQKINTIVLSNVNFKIKALNLVQYRIRDAEALVKLPQIRYQATFSHNVVHHLARYSTGGSR